MTLAPAIVTLASVPDVPCLSEPLECIPPPFHAPLPVPAPF